jgi:hypothetical protein
MIHDLDETIRQLLIKKGRLNAGEIDISFDQPTGDWAAGLSRPTINCWLYDARENLELRSMEWRVTRSNGQGQKRIAPLRFDLNYLVTAWTRKVEDEHQLLWRALGALAQARSLSPEQCVGALQGQPFDIPTKVGQVSDAVPNLTDLWSVLDNEMRAGFNFVVSLALDADLGFDGPLVLAKKLVVGQAEEPPRHELTVPDVEIWQRTKEGDGQQ